MMKMQSIEIPEFPRVRGEKVIEALYDFINEFVEQRDKELTDKQATALIKLTKELTSSIEAEKRSSTSDKDIKEMHFLSQLKQRSIKEAEFMAYVRRNERMTVPKGVRAALDIGEGSLVRCKIRKVET